VFLQYRQVVSALGTFVHHYRQFFPCLQYQILAITQTFLIFVKASGFAVLVLQRHVMEAFVIWL
ncbi:hypothetical protein LXA15_17545, partial [Erwinia amylovora]|uniref:hypothetical protein n=1 Tax=Erwinia amylovora TaxID=552 RepID=UPI0020C0A175